MSERSQPSDRARRNFLKSTVAASGAGLLSTVTMGASASGGDEDDAPYTQPFIVPLPVYRPKQAMRSLYPSSQGTAGDDECGRDHHQGWQEWPPKRFYQIEVKEGLHSFHPSLPVQKIWGYDGQVPGPTIQARYGEPIIVRMYNKLPKDHVGYGSPEISTHLHNLHCASESDGFTGNYWSEVKYGPTLTRPGKYMDYHYPNCYAGYDEYHDTNGDPREALGTLWYHDHRLDFTAPNVYKGLAGFYLLFDELDSGDENDPNPKALRLPSGVGVHDIPLVFQDIGVNAQGNVIFDQFETDGHIGNKFCVNGKVQPFFKVARRKYRFRLLDGGPSRFYQFHLTYNGVDQPFTYIANDGNLLPAPLTMTKVNLGVAERADIVIDFSQYPIGSQLFIVNRLEQKDGRGPTDNILYPGTQILRFDVDREPWTPDNSRVPPVLRELPPINLSKVSARRSWRFDRLNGFWTVNDKVFDINTPSAVIKRGSAEIWTLEGSGGWSHPVHIHFEEGRILSRNGKAPPPHERGRKDVFVLGPDDVVEVFIQFRDFVGKYMMHCHNTLHEDHAMMIRFDIVP